MIKRLLLGCWKDHDYLRERTDHGLYYLLCARCGHQQMILQADVLEGPAHQQKRDGGARTMKAVVVPKFRRLA